MKKKKYTKRIRWKRVFLFLFLLPATLVAATVMIAIFYVVKPAAIIDTIKYTPNQFFELEVPNENISLYKEAADKYEVPWTLLAAHHRVETKFSTMDPLLSPVGAEGHMQFMPCTFVGWTYPSCSGLGKGEIPEEEKTDPKTIAEYGGYGVDGNGDGKADPYNLADAIYSAANYLSQNGAADGDLEKAIFQYNHSDSYVDDILHYYHQYEKEFNSK